MPICLSACVSVRHTHRQIDRHTDTYIHTDIGYSQSQSDIHRARERVTDGEVGLLTLTLAV